MIDFGPAIMKNFGNDRYETTGQTYRPKLRVSHLNAHFLSWLTGSTKGISTVANMSRITPADNPPTAAPDELHIGT